MYSYLNAYFTTAWLTECNSGFIQVGFAWKNLAKEQITPFWSFQLKHNNIYLHQRWYLCLCLEYVLISRFSDLCQNKYLAVAYQSKNQIKSEYK